MVGAAPEEGMSKPRIVVLGSGGRLGAALVREWRVAGEDVTGLTRADLDLGDDERLRATLSPLGFDVLVNCAALTNVDLGGTEPELAHRINAHAVKTLAQIATAGGGRVIHISTDYVFDGAKQTPYVEEDAAEPISVYGASKRAGEIALLEVSDNHLVVRVSWVFGPDRPSFIDGILKRAIEHDHAEAIADKVAVPTYTLDAARLLRPFLADIPAGGLLHLCNGGACTWQEYGQHAIDCAVAAGVPMKARTVAPLRMADLKAFIARRPIYTAMSTQKLTRLSGGQPRDWRMAVEEYVRQHWVSR
jgi:dTDP-4-dehydrorhamnose reductase